MARLFGLLLLLLLLPPPPPVLLWTQMMDKCRWNVALNSYERLGYETEHFSEQLPIATVDQYFKKLTNSPTDAGEMYLGFPYYLRINFKCDLKKAEPIIRGSHLTGMNPKIRISFYTPVNFRSWKSERLQLDMEGAPLKRSCWTQDTCDLNWFTPMPMKNGSLVMEVEILSNHLGELVENARFLVNINGFMKREKGKLIFTLGTQARGITHRDFINTASRPVWSTVGQAPVLILGGIPDEKMILISDSGFDKISLVELNIDSCWLGSLQCPQEYSSASIFDTISTESTLFIRQNQLIYYFTGKYVSLKIPGSSNWVRVLHNRCIKRLCPVETPVNGSEYVLALTGGNEEGFFFLGIITDGTVEFKKFPLEKSLCQYFKVDSCKLHWVVYNTAKNCFMLLMEFKQNKVKETWLLQYIPYLNASTVDTVIKLYDIPQFVPNDGGLDFVMLLGMETYTQYPLIIRGLWINPFSNMMFIWGNAILQSYDYKNFIYLAEFPKESIIKYLASNYQGEVVCVTETEEIWFIVEGSIKVYKLYPSEGWNTIFVLSQLEDSTLYLHNETSVSVFYDIMGLQQLVYQVDKKGKGRLLKRLLPVNQILVYQQLSMTTHEETETSEGKILSFRAVCPFQMMQLRDLPTPQIFTRQERYHADAPFVSSISGFHNRFSLAIYQGLIYYLLWLHSKYNKPYADPVHDPTWSWWKEEKTDKNFFVYLASNFQSTYGLYINMDSYVKIYKQESSDRLPKYIYLDKGDSYRFTFYLTSPQSAKAVSSTSSMSNLRLAVVVADPMCVGTNVEKQNLINHNAILFKVAIQDKKACFDQGISGHNLMKTSVLIKVIDSAGKCFLKTRSGYEMLGNYLIPILIGCPLGKRLAFDITATLKYNKEENKRYFDCVHPDPEMPCFLFNDPFVPFFLIQDMVTGESGSFNGSYILKVIGGGISLDNITDYSEADIFRYNSPEDTSESNIWTILGDERKFGSYFILQRNTSGVQDVDKSTYCDYQLIFLLHVHGLPLSNSRALWYLWITLYVILGLLFFYILCCFLYVHVKRFWTKIKTKFTEIMTTESFYSYSTSSSMPSMMSSKISQTQSHEGERASVHRTKERKKP
ncbi:cation channel sperm-associated auxiliary subunit gamma-like isoform X2 [Monodelphis domestica]|uniref:Cation channel sperm-associated protein subunit gamma-like n=1 Tax=Monodelphis domestica TaxID=13616 RepID=A0A5F8GHP8_MONDO|nr:cation channel sperm-associated auxiliary subunit gamma-like isoform X2 [Monodelphis domestica]